MKSWGGGRERRASRRLDVVCVCVALGPTNDSLRRSDESFECCQPAECEIGADAVFFFLVVVVIFLFFLFLFLFFFGGAWGGKSFGSTFVCVADAFIFIYRYLFIVPFF